MIVDGYEFWVSVQPLGDTPYKQALISFKNFEGLFYRHEKSKDCWCCTGCSLCKADLHLPDDFASLKLPNSAYIGPANALETIIEQAVIDQAKEMVTRLLELRIKIYEDQREAA